MNIQRIDHDELEFIDYLTCTSDGKLFTGIAYELSEREPGKLICEISYIDGIQEGLSRDWYLSGQLQTEDYYHHGSKHGSYREWFENGQLKSEGEYELSIPIFLKEWDAEGNLIKDFRISEDSSYYERLTIYREIEARRNRK